MEKKKDADDHARLLDALRDKFPDTTATEAFFYVRRTHRNLGG